MDMNRELPNSWQEALAQGNAIQAYALMSIQSEGDEQLKDSLETLSQIQKALRAKHYQSALQRLQSLAAEQRAEVTDWQAFEVDLSKLIDSARQLERYQTDDITALLDSIQHPLLLAEKAVQQGTAYIFDNRLDEAKQSFDDALLLDPQHYRALTNIGNVMQEQKKLDEAIAFYQQALAVEPDYSNALHNLGVAYRHQGQMGQSIKYLKRAQSSKRKEDELEARQNLGHMRQQHGQRIMRWLIGIAVVIGIAIYLSR
jgi:tetratricopeptide (TPR) repeat protein